MKLSAIFSTNNMQATLDFYIPLGFEARDVMQEEDEIKSVRLLYRDNEAVCLKFVATSQKVSPGNVSFVIEEPAGELPTHQQERYGEPKKTEIVDPNGYRLIFKEPENL